MFVVVLALKIHLSKDAYDALKAFPEFVTECYDDIYNEVVIDCFLYHYALNRLFEKAYGEFRTHWIAHYDVVPRRIKSVRALRPGVKLPLKQYGSPTYPIAEICNVQCHSNCDYACKTTITTVF